MDTSHVSPHPTPTEPVEVAIIGGGPAGLSAALVIGRARRSVVVIDAGDPAHFVSDGVHGLIGLEGVPPRELRTRVWRELEPFDVSRVDGLVERVSGEAGAFLLELADGATVVAERIVLATGLRYGVQPVDGLAAQWGNGVYHCPFCHGWESRGQRIAVIGVPESVGHQTTMLGLWSDSVQAFTSGDELPGVPVAASVRREGEQLVITEDGGAEHRVDAIFGMPVMTAVGDLPEQLGLPRAGTLPPMMAPVPVGLGVDLNGETERPGVFAAGDLVGMPSLVGAVTSGNAVGVGIVRLISEARAAAGAAH